MPWPYHQRSWQVLGPGVVLGVSMKEDRPWLGGGAVYTYPGAESPAKAQALYLPGPLTGV